MNKLKVDPSIFTIPNNIAVTGRVKSWLVDLKQSINEQDNTLFNRLKNKFFGYNISNLRRLPVSCTVYVVGDSMDEIENSIEHSWLFTSQALRNGAGVAIHLSNLRPKDTPNGKGLVSSGPVSFAQIYSKLNEILRRGGTFRNGAIVLHLDYDHPDILEFATAPRELLPWARRAINVDDDFINHPHLDTLLKYVETGDCFLVKKQFDKNGLRLYHNVCLEILLPHRGSCLLSHVNLGALKIDEIVPTFIDGMDWLCKLHSSTGVDLDGYYLAPKEDKQIGLGVLGLANLLAIENITYEELVRGMEKVLGLSDLPTSDKGFSLAWTLYKAYQESAKVARKYKMDRAFTIAPTANCSFKYKDREFYVTTPEIAPPVDINVERDSQTMGVIEVDYHPDCQIASQVGWNVYYRLNKCWQMYMDSTGLAHSISTNWWSDRIQMNKDFISDWLKSPLKSLYYAWQVSPQVQDKSEIITSNNEHSQECLPCKIKNENSENAYNTECSSCAE